MARACAALLLLLVLPVGPPPTEARHLAKWPRVYLHDPGTRLIFQRSLDRVSARLTEPSCQAIFGAFRDKSGAALTTKLATFKASPIEYLRLVLFVDSVSTSRCGPELAHTVPGNRVVYVCGRQFETTWRANAEHAEMAIIHETLHSLGLGENPPPSNAITDQVRRACGNHVFSRRR